MTNFRVRAGAAIALVAGWAAACGGTSFTASGGGSGTGGTSASAGSGHAGSAQAGSDQAGSGQAGTSQGGSGLGGSGQGGSGQGGAGEAGSGQGGLGKGGSGKGGSGHAGSAQGGSAQGGSGQAGSGQAGSGQAGHPAGGTGGASSGGMSGGGNAGAGGIRNSGDCDLDKQCGNGKCVTLSVGGFRTCVLPVPPPTTCTANDKCCPNSPDKPPPCMSGTCLAGPLAPSCGGLVFLGGNTCAVDQCTQNSDCSGNNAICAPAGSLDRKINTCLAGGCRRDSECNAEAGGKCEPVTNHCCNGVTGLYCVYPSTGCRSQADCPSGFCQITNNRADCTPGAAVCPG